MNTIDLIEEIYSNNCPELITIGPESAALWRIYHLIKDFKNE